MKDLYVYVNPRTGKKAPLLSDEVYNYPQTPFVASFVGENNPFYGKVISKEKNLVKVDCQGTTFIANSGHIDNSKKHTFSE